MAVTFFLYFFSRSRLTITAPFFLYAMNFLYKSNVFLDYSFENWIYIVLQCFINNNFGLIIFYMVYLIVANYFGKNLFFNIFLLCFAQFLNINIGSLSKLEFFNTGLFNGIILIHPLVLFISYSLILLFLFEFFFNIKSLKTKNSLNKTLVYYTFYYISIAILLGAIWAQQELNWGGWWGWDLIEVGSLVWLVLTILFLHLKLFNLYFIGLRNFIILAFFFFYLGLRFSFFDSIHAFVGDSLVNIKSYSFIYVLPIFYMFTKASIIKRNNIFLFFILFLYFLVLVILKDFLSKYYYLELYSIFGVSHIFFISFFIFSIFFFNTYFNFIFGVLPFLVNFLYFFKIFVLKGRFYHSLFYLFLLASVLLKFEFFQSLLINNNIAVGVITNKHFLMIFNETNYYEILQNAISIANLQKYYLAVSVSSYIELESILSQVDIWTNYAYFNKFIIMLVNYNISYYFIVPSLFCVSAYVLLKK